MTLGDIVAFVRFLEAEPGTQRFTQADMAMLASQAQIQLALELSFDQGTWVQQITGGVGLYQLPELIKILRVYMQGPDGSMQPIFGTDLPTIEGTNLETYDNTSGTQVGAPVQSPQWMVAPQQSYPVTTNVQVGGQVQTKLPYQPNQRPTYFLRGGYLNLVPIPLSTSPQTNLVVDYIPSPTPLSNLSDISPFPALCKDALAWKMIEYMRTADSLANAADATQRYNLEVSDKLRPWLRNIQGNRPKGMIVYTPRTRLRGR